MSKQRPWHTFEEAFYTELLSKNFYEVDNLTLDLIKFYKNNDVEYRSETFLTWNYLFGKDCSLIHMFWQCLCYQWGERSDFISNSYILSDYIPLIVESIMHNYYMVIDMVSEDSYNEDKF